MSTMCGSSTINNTDKKHYCLLPEKKITFYRIFLSLTCSFISEEQKIKTQNRGLNNLLVS
jgi:hypothetical protein